MIPDFQTIMLPLLEFFADGKEHSKGEAVEYIVDRFSLSENEKNLIYPVSKAKVVYSKVHFAETYLKNAGLITSIGRGLFKITNRGLTVLKDKPTKIDVSFLEQYPEFVEFKNRRRDSKIKQEIEKTTETELSPIELLEKGHAKIKDDLVRDLLEQIKNRPPEFFEKLVVELLLKMGYGGSRDDAGKAIGKTADGGIDGVIREDKLGLDVIYIQAKRWDNPVGSPHIHQFIGSLANKNANKGVFITTSTFTEAAKNSIQGPYRIILIDGETLAQLMIDYNIGVFTKATYEIKEIDTDYFSED